MRVRSGAMTILAEVVRRHRSAIGASGLLALMEAIGFKEPSVRTVIFRLRQEGLLTAVREGGRAVYSLTADGLRRIEAGNRRTFETYREGWDGYWRVLTYNVPERERALRDELRKELVWLGFGQLTVSTWISPRKVADYVMERIRRHGMQRYVQVFEARHLGLVSSQELVNQAWNLQAIADQYAAFLRDLRGGWGEGLIEGAVLTREEAFAERVRLVDRYQSFLEIDPWLPIELLPSGWIGDEARRLFWAYYLALSPQADHFLAEHLEA